MEAQRGKKGSQERIVGLCWLVLRSHALAEFHLFQNQHPHPLGSRLLYLLFLCLTSPGHALFASWLHLHCNLHQNTPPPSPLSNRCFFRFGGGAPSICFQRTLYFPIILVSLGCHSRILRTGRLKQQKFFSQFWKAGSPISKYHHRSLSPWLTDGCLLAVSSHGLFSVHIPRTLSSLFL